MGLRDFHSSVDQYLTPASSAQDTAEMKMNRILRDLAREAGLEDSEIMLFGEQHDEFTLVYDKFSTRTR